MMKIDKLIASLNVQIEGSDSVSMRILDTELALYPPAQGEPDLVIQYSMTEPDKTWAQNPSIHFETKTGFRANFGVAIVEWCWDEKPRQIKFAANISDRNLKYKIRNIQYNYPYEDIGQIFHELVLIPTIQIFFSEQIALIHGSALATPDDQVLVFGGTGGVGKTSLELSLIKTRDYRFLADDIVILDQSGMIWPNFAYPKIYGYNTLGEADLKQRLLRGRSWDDRLVWELQMLRSPNKVRRRANPVKIFDGKIAQGGSLKSFYFLFRCNVPSLNIVPLDPDIATDMNLEVMASEYTILYRHLNWHRVNRLGLQQSGDNFISLSHILQNWSRIQREILGKTSCYLVQIPLEMDAHSLKSGILSMIGQRS